jgi:hypothetical protein
LDSIAPASKKEAQAGNSYWYSDTFPSLPDFADFAQILVIITILIIFVASSIHNFTFGFHVLVSSFGFIDLRYFVAMGIHGASSASTYLAIASEFTASAPNFSCQVLFISPIQAVLSVHLVSVS